jgi:exodeoxyribonuclease V gamma subunit
MALHLYRSNRTERLARALADQLAAPLDSPLQQEWLVVQGRGMAIWLQQQLSRALGVWAGGRFLYPRSFLRELYRAVVGERAAGLDGWSPAAMRWQLMTVLEALVARPELAALRSYVSDDDDGLRMFELASEVADAFDRYLTYRPDMIHAWEQGSAATTWQALVWRALVERIDGDHVARLERELLGVTSAVGVADVASATDVAPGELPPRVSVFGLSTLPPMYVRALAALARRCEVHVYLLSPSREYWEELSATLAREQAVARDQPVDDLHLDTGHPLLESLGTLGAEFQRVMRDELDALSVAEVEPRDDLYELPSDATLLGALQRDLLELEPRQRVAPRADRSIALHACHSPMREVEVLHDQLLALLTGGGDLEPHQVVVMLPDVDAYAPLIEAVFERERDDPSYIPYRIADRTLRPDAPVVDAFHRIVDLADRRVTAGEVLDLVALDAVRRRFDIDVSEVDELTRWVGESGIRWGIDDAHRARHGQPAVAQNTWRFGLQRLLLGYALPGDGERLFKGVLPYDEIEGQSAALLGKFAELCDSLFECLEALDGRHPVAAWRDRLADVLTRLVELDDDGAWQHQLVLDALEQVVQQAAQAGFERAVSLEVVLRHLRPVLDEAQPARGFLSSGVSFCAMVPMRSIPFRVVCLLGMSDGAFPRHDTPSELDPSEVGPRRAGDRSRRLDDRFLFLEALLAARERVVITYTGRSIRDNSLLPPSVVVGELLDALAAGYDDDPAAQEDDDQRLARVLPGLVTQHPLQPFSPRYFDASTSTLFSYQERYLIGARSVASDERRSTAPLFDGPLPSDPQLEGAALSVAQLVRFFENPLHELLRRRLGVELRERELEVPDREPIELQALERYQVGDLLLGMRLRGVDSDRTLALARASGLLPIGAPGLCDHEELLRGVERIVEAVRALRSSNANAALPVDAALPDGTRIRGELSERFGGGLFRHQYARVHGKRLLGTWLLHLLHCWQAPDGAGVSTLVGRPSLSTDGDVVVHRFAPVERPERALQRLVSLFHQGQREPLELFPSVSFRYVAALSQRPDDDPVAARERAMRQAQHALREALDYDPALRRVLGGEPDLSALPRSPGTHAARFEALAREVFEPLVAHLESPS